MAEKLSDTRVGRLAHTFPAGEFLCEMKGFAAKAEAESLAAVLSGARFAAGPDLRTARARLLLTRPHQVTPLSAPRDWRGDCSPYCVWIRLSCGR